MSRRKRKRTYTNSVIGQEDIAILHPIWVNVDPNPLLQTLRASLQSGESDLTHPNGEVYFTFRCTMTITAGDLDVLFENGKILCKMIMSETVSEPASDSSSPVKPENPQKEDSDGET